MSHEAYSPVGYIYRAEQYCLECICDVVGTDGIVRNACGCEECRLDRMAITRGIDRYDEWSYDSDDFPKSIPYHNDLHAECGPESYGYGPDDPEWDLQYCGAYCAKCHEVIDGVSHIDGPDTCPVYDNR